MTERLVYIIAKVMENPLWKRILLALFNEEGKEFIHQELKIAVRFEMEVADAELSQAMDELCKFAIVNRRLVPHEGSETRYGSRYSLTARGVKFVKVLNEIQVAVLRLDLPFKTADAFSLFFSGRHAGTVRLTH